MAELRSRTTLVPLAGLVLLLLVPPLARLLDDPYLVTLAGRIVIYALAAASLDLILGYGGMVSLGHAAFFGVGAYGVAAFAFHADEGTPLLGLPGSYQALTAWPLTLLGVGLLALIIGAICLRTRGMHFIMITLAFAQMLYFLLISLPGYGGEDGLNLWSRSEIPGLDLHDPVTFFYLCLGLLVAYLLLARRLSASRFGMVLQGARQNERRLEAIGIPVYPYRLAAFVVAALGAGLAGILAANHSEYVSPALLHWTRSGEILIMVLLGGMGTLFGPVLGAAALLLMEEILAGYTEHWQAGLGIFLILVVLFARRGLYGLLVGEGR